MEEIKHVFLGAGLFGHPQAFICNGQQPDLKVAALFSEKENALKNKDKQKKITHVHMYIKGRRKHCYVFKATAFFSSTGFLHEKIGI